MEPLIGFVQSVAHVPIRVWQERAGEITWRCSCGTVNKHIPVRFVEDLSNSLHCVSDRSQPSSITLASPLGGLYP